MSSEVEEVLLGGNAWITNDAGGAHISDDCGIAGWTNKCAVASAFFKVITGGALRMSIKAKVQDGSSVIKVVYKETAFTVNVSTTNWETIYVGELTVPANRYVRVDFVAESRTGSVYADVYSLLVAGEATADRMIFVREPENFYYGRRGPSCHLWYRFPSANVEYFYNEITVPDGNDVIGSYYMTNGFSGGYFGIQVNSTTERRILFSVWSGYSTNDPDEVPDEYTVKPLGSGEGVVVREFGGEGSGGQSYLTYSWKAGVTYKFLNRARPDPANEGSTEFTAWFYDPDKDAWRLIARFSRPKYVTWYKGCYSFLENFRGWTSYQTRRCEFGNQWAVTEAGDWVPVTLASFSYDSTASNNRRADYRGGLTADSSGFYLKNCGFFDENTAYGTVFERQAPKQEDHPVIDLAALPR
jgi:hypothetical protein